MRNDIAQRIRLSKRRFLSHQNCFGTALFVLGLKDEEREVEWDHTFWGHGQLYDIIMSLKKAGEPIDGGLILFRNEKRIGHMGVIIEVSPVEIFHRPCYYSTSERKLLSIIEGTYVKDYSIVEYYFRKN